MDLSLILRRGALPEVGVIVRVVVGNSFAPASAPCNPTELGPAFVGLMSTGLSDPFALFPKRGVATDCGAEAVCDGEYGSSAFRMSDVVEPYLTSLKADAARVAAMGPGSECCRSNVAPGGTLDGAAGWLNL